MYIHTAPTPRIFLRSHYLYQGIIGEAHELVCLIAISSTAQTSSVNLTWNFTSNDDRVTVIPTTITTDDSIGIIYTTVIQFAYLVKGDERNYKCSLTIEEDSLESTFNLRIISKLINYSIIVSKTYTNVRTNEHMQVYNDLPICMYLCLIYIHKFAGALHTKLG